uniref:Homeodomain transcription factor n=1 Tax=Phaffia rhodozyma TaxID=264483 RepID=A0A193H5Q1_PHARH|nr:homeodomain transcription factor [Phaffia rhodozyma]
MYSFTKLPQKYTGLGDVFDSNRDPLSSKEFALEDLYLPIPPSICETLEELGTPHTLARSLGALYLSRAIALRDLSLSQFDAAFPAERTFLLEANSLKLKVFKGLLKATLEHRYSMELSHHQETIIQLAGVWTSDDEQAPVSVRRSSFTKNTIDTLQALYDLNQYPNPIELKTIAVKVGLQPKQIRAWFQNRRNRRSSPARSHKKPLKISTRATFASDPKFNSVRKRCFRRTSSIEKERKTEGVPSQLGSPIFLQTNKTPYVPQSEGRSRVGHSLVAGLFDTSPNEQDAYALWSAVLSDRSSAYANFKHVPQIESSLAFAVPEPADSMSAQCSKNQFNNCSESSSSHPAFPPVFSSSETMEVDPVDWTMVFAATNSRSIAPMYEKPSARWESKTGLEVEDAMIDVSSNTTAGKQTSCEKEGCSHRETPDDIMVRPQFQISF